MMRGIALATMAIFLAGPAQAEETVPFCDALKEKSLYRQWKSYKYMEAGRDGWMFRTLSDYKRPITLKDSDINRLQRLNQVLAARGSTLILSVLPTRGMTGARYSLSDTYDVSAAWEKYHQLVSVMRAAGVRVASIDESAVQEGNFYFRRDNHWTPAGAKTMAQAVAAQVKAAGITLPVKKFVTDAGNPVPHKGVFEKILQEGCGVEIKPETVPDYRTYSPEEQADLFGDTARPSIVLLGTSNSVHAASHANFEGFLKDALSADIDNRAVSGGGSDTAMLQWLASQDHINHPPRVVIWEFPVHDDFYNRHFLRQAIPAAEGPCPTPVVTATVASDAKKITMADGWAGHDIRAKDHYIHLTFSVPPSSPFDMTWKGIGEETQEFRFTRASHYREDGIYYLDMEEGMEPVNTLDMTFSTPPGGFVTVNVCPRKLLKLKP